MAHGSPLGDCGSFSYNEGVIIATESSTSTMQRGQGAEAKSIILKPSVPKRLHQAFWSQARGPKSKCC